jgi:hypothetical protein
VRIDIGAEVTMPDEGSRVLRVPRIDRFMTARSTSGVKETFEPVVKSMVDEELVRQVAQGNDRALSELYDRYSRPV